MKNKNFIFLIFSLIYWNRATTISQYAKWFPKYAQIVDYSCSSYHMGWLVDFFYSKIWKVLLEEQKYLKFIFADTWECQNLSKCVIFNLAFAFFIAENLEVYAFIIT